MGEEEKKKKLSKENKSRYLMAAAGVLEGIAGAFFGVCFVFIVRDFLGVFMDVSPKIVIISLSVLTYFAVLFVGMVIAAWKAFKRPTGWFALHWIMGSVLFVFGVGNIVFSLVGFPWEPFYWPGLFPTAYGALIIGLAVAAALFVQKAHRSPVSSVGATESGQGAGS